MPPCTPARVGDGRTSRVDGWLVGVAVLVDGGIPACCLWCQQRSVVCVLLSPFLGCWKVIIGLWPGLVVSRGGIVIELVVAVVC